ncbi:MAG: T9SS type A sorting domain-containing protein [Bacteroidales bacterium]|nr:T9SS type A sorting domain-containing protein [Bacteroidales bacterium]
MTPPGTVNATDQARLVDYLNNYNGNLYIESTKLGYDHFGTSMMAQFGIKFQDHGDVYEVQAIESKDQDLLANINYVYAGGDSPHYIVDRLIPTGATLLYSSEDNYQRIFFYNPDDQYKVISSSVVFGALKDGDSLSMKPYLMAEMINYLMGSGTTTSLFEAFGNTDEFAVSAYPNPFSNQINIGFDLQQGSQVYIRIYDHSGRVVKELVNGQLPAGNHSFTWNGQSNTGFKLDDGLYVYKIEFDEQVRSGKIVLTR